MSETALHPGAQMLPLIVGASDDVSVAQNGAAEVSDAEVVSPEPEVVEATDASPQPSEADETAKPT